MVVDWYFSGKFQSQQSPISVVLRNTVCMILVHFRYTVKPMFLFIIMISSFKKCIFSSSIISSLFLARTTWDTAVGIQIPVQVHIKGTSGKGGPHSFEHYYNFFEFRPTLTAEDNGRFEVRMGYFIFISLFFVKQ